MLDLCEVVGVKWKIVYCLYVICVLFFFNVGVKEKFICEWIGYWFNVLLKYEKFSEENKGKVFYLLGLNVELSIFKGEIFK